MNTTRIKDLPVSNQPVWFVERRLGYGWTPANRMGWLVVIALIAFELLNTAFFATLLGRSTPDMEPLLIGQFLLGTAGFLGSIIVITSLTGTPLKRKKFFGNK